MPAQSKEPSELVPSHAGSSDGHFSYLGCSNPRCQCKSVFMPPIVDMFSNCFAGQSRAMPFVRVGDVYRGVCVANDLGQNLEMPAHRVYSLSARLVQMFLGPYSMDTGVID